MTAAGSPRVEYLAGSGWADRPAAAVPALAGEVTCDVAVVGGGLLGMAAALQLAERGADVVLLEADLCGSGASSRSAGYLTNTLAADADLLSTIHRKRMHDLVGFADAAVHFTEGLLARLSIECDYQRTGIVGAAVSRGQLRKGRRWVRTLAGAGADSEFVGASELGLPPTFLGGLRERVGGLLNPGKYAFGLRDAVLASRARVFEQTPVQTVANAGTGVTVGVEAGRVRAERVLLATNAYSRDLPIAPRRLAKAIWVTQVETEPIAPERLDEIGWTSRAPIATLHVLLENYRLTPRNTVVIGTRQLQPARGPLRGRRPDAPVVADLVRGFRDRFPTLGDVAPRRAWGGWIAMTPSWLPVAGEVNPRVLYGIGCNGHGLAQAPYLGTLLADRLAGGAVDLRGIWRERPRFAPAPLTTAPGLRAAWTIDRIADRAQRLRGAPTTPAGTPVGARA